MINVETETMITLQEAVNALPNRPHISTIHRWRLRGVKGVTLETCFVGGRRMTSHEALHRFSRAITAVAEGRDSCEIAPVVDQAIVERELDANGIVIIAQVSN